MPELEAGFQELTAILREARDAVRKELELRQAQDVDNEALLRLLTAVRSFADQAESLFIMMTDRDAEKALRVEVSDLAKSFWATEELIEMDLGLDQT